MAQIEIEGEQATLQEWRGLLELCQRYWQMKLCQCTPQAAMMGVVIPDWEDTFYCTPIHSGLAMLIGFWSLHAFVNLSDRRRSPPEQREIMARLSAIFLRYGPSRVVGSYDRQVFGQLGLRFRGNWPLLRRHTPGWVPWFLNRREVHAATLVLEQVLEVFPRLLGDPRPLTLRPDLKILTRTLVEEQGTKRWEEKLADIEGQLPKLEPHIDELQLVRLCSTKKKQEGKWIVDVFHAEPVYQGPGKRAYIMQLMLVVDSSTRAVIHFSMLDPWELEERVAVEFMDCLEASTTMPRQVEVEKAEVKLLLEPVTKALDISLVFKERIPFLRTVKESFVELDY
jgi:hypothetical protein